MYKPVHKKVVRDEGLKRDEVRNLPIWGLGTATRAVACSLPVLALLQIYCVEQGRRVRFAEAECQIGNSGYST